MGEEGRVRFGRHERGSNGARWQAGKSKSPEEPSKVLWRTQKKSRDQNHRGVADSPGRLARPASATGTRKRPGATDRKDVMGKIRVLLADDHTLFRQGIRTLISADADMEVVGEAPNGGDAVNKAAEKRPDLILMDIGMPGLSSFEATRQIKKNRPDTKVLFLTMYDDEDYLVESMEVGASGYVLKDSPATQLVAAMRDVCRGGSYLSPRMLSQLVDDFRSRIKSANRVPRFGTLTPREREVLKLLAEGNSVKEIAGDLNLSVKTVEAHRANMMKKVRVSNAAQLLNAAIQEGLIQIK